MKHIKLFENFLNSIQESGISNIEVKELTDKISDLLYNDYYARKEEYKESDYLGKDEPVEDDEYPEHFGLPDPNNVNLTVRVDCNQSKYGLKVDVNFGSSTFLDWKKLNPDLKQTTNFVEDIIDIIENHQGATVKLIAYKYFGQNAEGQKDGRKLEIEDVLPKLRTVVEKFHNDELPTLSKEMYQPMYFAFIVK